MNHDSCLDWLDVKQTEVNVIPPPTPQLRSIRSQKCLKAMVEQKLKLMIGMKVQMIL